MSSRLFPAPAGKPIKDPLGVANGLPNYTGFRSWLPGVFDRDFVVIEDFRYGFSCSHHTDTATADASLSVSPWYWSATDGGGDNVHSIMTGQNAPDGSLTIRTNNAANDTLNIAYSNEAITTGKPFSFEVKMAGNDTSALGFFCGLSIHIADEGGDLVENNMANMVGFLMADGNAADDVLAITRAASSTTQTQVITTLADAAVHTYGCDYNGLDTVKFYVDGVLVATHTEGIPASGAYLAPTVEVRAIGTAQPYLTINHMGFYQPEAFTAE